MKKILCVIIYTLSFVFSNVGEFEKISDDVDAFVKVSDPKTIRNYVKELNI